MEPTSEQAVISVTRYRDSHGEPTCAVSFPEGKVCQFYLTQRLGCNETCLFANKDGRYWEQLKRRGLEVGGTLIPLEGCPVWVEEGK